MEVLKILYIFGQLLQILLGGVSVTFLSLLLLLFTVFTVKTFFLYTSRVHGFKLVVFLNKISNKFFKKNLYLNNQSKFQCSLNLF